MGDLRHAVRLLVRDPALTMAVTITLTLAIGATSAIYTIVHAVLLAPLPIAEPDRVVAVWETNPRPEETLRIASTANVASWGAASRRIETFGVWRDWSMRLQTRDGPQPLAGAIVSADLFRVLRVQPGLGRVFSRDEDVPGKNLLVLLSYRAWRDRFGADASIVGRTLTLSRSPDGPRPFTVVGVLPAAVLPSMDGFDFWAPASIDPDAAEGRWLRNRRVVARLASGATIESARAELSGIASALGREFPDSNAGWGVALAPIVDVEVGSMRGPLAMFSGAIAFLLLIACANVAGLLLARASGRGREIGIRLALGAGRARIVRMLLAESVLLAGLSALGGVLAGSWFIAAFHAYGPALPRAGGLAIDGGVVRFTCGVALVVGVLFGLAPALQCAAIAPVESLKDASRSLLRARGVRLRTGLVTAEIALALVLLVGAGLAIRSFAALMSAPLGVDPHNLIVFQVFPPASRYGDDARLTAVYREIADRVRRVPGVRSVGQVSAGPLFGGVETAELGIEGAPPAGAGTAPQPRFFDASPGYFAAVGMRITAGRDFDARDRADAPPVAIVNEAFARTWLPAGAVGRRVRLAHDDRPPLEIVGVVSDVRHELAPGASASPEIYWPAEQHVRGAIYFVVRTSIDPASVVPAARAALLDLDRDLVPARFPTLEQTIDRSARQPRFNGLLLGAFAAIALLLASVGIYGLVSYAAAQRTKEIGIRISLGANPSDVVWLVVAQGVRVTVAGAALGLGGAVAIARLLASMFAGVQPLDPVAFGVAALVLGAVTMGASLVPARRATRVNPVLALKSE